MGKGYALSCEPLVQAFKQSCALIVVSCDVEHQMLTNLLWALCVQVSLQSCVRQEHAPKIKIGGTRNTGWVGWG